MPWSLIAARSRLTDKKHAKRIAKKQRNFAHVHVSHQLEHFVRQIFVVVFYPRAINNSAPYMAIRLPALVVALR